MNILRAVPNSPPAFSNDLQGVSGALAEIQAEVIGDVYAVARIPRLPSLTRSTREELKNMPAKSKPSPKKKAQGKVRDIKPGKNPKGGIKGSVDAPFIRRLR